MRGAGLLFSCLVAAAVGIGVGLGHAAPPKRLPDPNTWKPTSGATGVPSPVVYPAQRLPLGFSHGRHIARGMACIDCHADALTSVASGDRLLPGEPVCARCHPIDRTRPTKIVAGQPPAACTACHPGWTPDGVVDRVAIPPPNLRFSHAAHRATPCQSCHGALTSTDLATRADLPTMTSCLACHDGKAADRTCITCHPADAAGRVRTALPDGALVPRTDQLGDAHDPTWRRTHAVAARAPAPTCSSCHAQEDCVDCHAGTVKSFDFHAGDYALSHATEARRGVPDCTVCHRQSTFCVGCHERAGVGARAETDFDRNAPDRRFHPNGWAGGLHAREARRNLDACASCHREELCLTCHSAQPTAGRISPHPPGWRGSAKCRAMDKRNRRMCLRCHITVDQLGCSWSAFR